MIERVERLGCSYNSNKFYVQLFSIPAFSDSFFTAASRTQMTTYNYDVD